MRSISLVACTFMVTTGLAPIIQGQRDFSSPQSRARIREVFNWNQMDFAYPSAEARAQAIQSGQFDPAAIYPMGIQVS
jgi:hypothetical protein